jgi:hypothetical protein
VAIRWSSDPQPKKKPKKKPKSPLTNKRKRQRAKDDKSLEIDRQIWELRSKLGMTTRAIASKLGFKDHSSVGKRLVKMREACAGGMVEEIKLHRQVDLERTEQLYGLLMQTCLKTDLNGEVRFGVGMEPKEAAAIVQAGVSLLDRRAKMRGDDGPVKIEDVTRGKGDITPEAVRAAIAEEFSSRATPKGPENGPDQRPEPTSSSGTQSDGEASSRARMAAVLNLASVSVLSLPAGMDTRPEPQIAPEQVPPDWRKPYHRRGVGSLARDAGRDHDGH